MPNTTGGQGSPTPGYVPMFYSSHTGNAPASFLDLITNFKQNFLRKSVEIIPGLTFNQYDTIKRAYFYVHNQFISGNIDEQGNPKQFYDLLTDRNDQAAKNIHLDTKDILIEAKNQNSFLKSWLLRKEYEVFAQKSRLGVKLNDLADDLPDFGTVVWKKCLYEKDVDTRDVSLLMLMNDPLVKCLKDGPVIERLLMTSKDIVSKKMFYPKAVEKLLASYHSNAYAPFITDYDNALRSELNAIDQTTDYYELWEFWGYVPLYLYAKYHPKRVKQSYLEKHRMESIYCFAIASGFDADNVLYIEDVDPKKFPYKEVHFRKMKGRWLGQGNYELCFNEQEEANELKNRYINSMRITLSHFYQTRDGSPTRNIVTDLEDGDILEVESEITSIPTELRGAQDYRLEMQALEARVDRKVNALEVVTGESMPSGTPWKLGAQQNINAKKMFDKIKENCGLFIEEVVNDWLIPDFKKMITKEHIIDLVGDQDDLELIYSAFKKTVGYNFLKDYILSQEDFPSQEQMQLVERLATEQLGKVSKKLWLPGGYFDQNDDYNLKVVTTGENEAKQNKVDTLTTLYTTLAANPAAVQDERLMKILNKILEMNGISPFEVDMINTAQPNISLNPANQGGANPAQQQGGGGAKGGNVKQFATAAQKNGAGVPFTPPEIPPEQG